MHLLPILWTKTSQLGWSQHQLLRKLEVNTISFGMIATWLYILVVKYKQFDWSSFLWMTKFSHRLIHFLQLCWRALIEYSQKIKEVVQEFVYDLPATNSCKDWTGNISISLPLHKTKEFFQFHLKCLKHFARYRVFIITHIWAEESILMFKERQHANVGWAQFGKSFRVAITQFGPSKQQKRVADFWG